jgi:hypothetical protein
MLPSAGAGPGPPSGAAGSTAGTWRQVAVAPFSALVHPVSRFAIIQIGRYGLPPPQILAVDASDESVNADYLATNARRVRVAHPERD